MASWNCALCGSPRPSIITNGRDGTVTRLALLAEAVYIGLNCLRSSTFMVFSHGSDAPDRLLLLAPICDIDHVFVPQHAELSEGVKQGIRIRSISVWPIELLDHSQTAGFQRSTDTFNETDVVHRRPGKDHCNQVPPVAAEIKHVKV